MLAVEKCCSADLITPDDAETHLQAVQRWVEERENRTRADEWSDMAISLQEKYAEIATLREENERMRTEGVSLSNQREMAVAETREHKATIARLREEVANRDTAIENLTTGYEEIADERNTYRGALEYCERHILDTCNESHTLIVIRKALKEGDPGEVPDVSYGANPPHTPFLHGSKPCPDCTPSKEGGEG
jgi:chromosome segregation ATPase